MAYTVYNVLRVHFVRLDPLQEQPVGREAIRCRLVVVAREQAGHAASERIRGFGRNDVVAVGREQQQFSRVADGHVHFGIPQYVAVDRGRGTSDLENERLDFDGVDAIDRRHGAQPPGGAAAAETDHESATGGRIENRTERAEHDLCAGVANRGAVRFSVYEKRIAALVVVSATLLSSRRLPRRCCDGRPACGAPPVRRRQLATGTRLAPIGL